MLSAQWVDLIHSKLVLAYGARFWEQYRGLDPETVKRSWAQALTNLSTEQLKFALQRENLDPNYPPNELQFLAVCKRYREPIKPLPQLSKKTEPLTPQQRERMRQAIESITSMPRDPKRCARMLREREKAGELLSPVQRRHWRDVLGEE